jgi:DNA-binding CsgD family transcriptional regulator
VAVIHPEALVAEAMAAALARLPGIVSSGFGTTARDAERLAERAEGIAIDARVPGGELAAGRVRAKGVRAVVIGDPRPGDEGVQVPTNASLSTLARALVPALAERPATPSRLTKRQQEILALVASGMAAKQVARQLGISAKTVEQHKTHIFAKLGVPNQTAAVSLVMSNGLTQGWGDSFGNGANGRARNGDRLWIHSST